MLVCSAGLFAAQDSTPTRVEIAGETWELGPVRPAPGPIPAQLEGWRDIACADCHTTIAEEWSRSLHALAWEDPLYLLSLEGLRRPDSCHPCHAPEPLHITGVGVRPEFRAENRRHGVDCLSCHGGVDGTVHGPWGAPTDAHTSVKSASFLPEGMSELCLSCHSTTVGPVIGLGRDFQRHEQHEAGKSCVACHMRPVERSAAVHPVTGEASPVRPGRSHEFQSARDPAFLAQAFALEAHTNDAGTVFVVRNRCAHRVPGLEDRWFVFHVAVQGAEGEVLAEGVLEIAKATFLPVEGAAELELAATGPRVSVRGVHHSPALHEPVEFVSVVLEVEQR